MARLLLVRHGESVWNVEHRWQGWADPPLSPRGEEQAAEAASRLEGVALGALASSDLMRARCTAEVLGAALGLGPVHVDSGLRERDVGDWSGLTTADIESRWPGLIDAWHAGRLAGPPGGETNHAFTDRVVDAIRRIGDVADDGGVLVVTHGGVIRALERHAGTAAQTLPNMGGRWFEVRDGVVRAGPIVALLDPETPAVAPVF